MKRIIGLFSFILLLVPFASLAQSPCQGNFDCDQDVDGSDAAVFKSDFGRSTYQNACPTSDPCYLCSEINPLPRTGKTTSYATGDDGGSKRGVAWPNPRFTDKGNGTVTDNLTGLIWLKNANCLGLVVGDWNAAVAVCYALTTGNCGLTDGSQAGGWRLPNRFELESLLDLEYDNPALPNTAGTGQLSEGNPFSNVQQAFYWSSTCYPYYSGNPQPWVVNMSDGRVNWVPPDNFNLVWCVKGGY